MSDYKLKSKFLNSTDRESVIDKVRKYAGYTLPYIYPDEEVTDSEEIQNDYQSLGSRAVTHLANKIMMALFQPSRPFFRMELTGEQLEQVMASAQLNGAQIDAALSKQEREAMKVLTRKGGRTALLDALILLIIGGDAMLYVPKGEDKLQTYSILDYNIKRDLAGEMYEAIICEKIEFDALDEDLRSTAVKHNYKEGDTLSIFTGIERDGDRYKVWQELEDICKCNDRDGNYTKDTLPFIPLVWKLVRGNNFGTGYVEDYAGDFHFLSTTSECTLDFVSAMTDVKHLVNPAGQTDVDELTQAPSGSYVNGTEEDLYCYTADLSSNAAFLTEQADRVERRLAAAFLLNTSVTRDAERVTAEEIRMQAHELESSLGGVYSRQAGDLQLPLAKRIMTSMNALFKEVEPSIITGFESLSRSSDLDRLRAFMQDFAILSDVPEQVAIRIDYNQLIAALGAGHGVEYDKFLKDEEQVKKDQAEMAQAQAATAGIEAGAVAEAQGQGQQSQ
jgi:hypothetical protein